MRKRFWRWRMERQRRKFLRYGWYDAVHAMEDVQRSHALLLASLAREQR